MKNFNLRPPFIIAALSVAVSSVNAQTNTARPPIEEVFVAGYQRDYRENEAESALGLNLKLIETPAAVSVITQDLLQDQQVNNVDDALRNVAGVTKFKTGNGGEERFSIRGFDASQSIYKDGARINNSFNASNIPSTETANIDRIEVLKGPSALLYGQGEPGGIINYITKRPQIERYGSIEVLAGSDDFKKIEADTTGAIGSLENFAYRVVATYEDSESFRNEVFRERILVNPTLAYIGSDTYVQVGVEYIDDESTQDRGQVLDGNNVQGYFYSDRLNREQFFGIPDWNRNTTAESTRIYALAEHKVNDIWDIAFSYSNTKNDKVNFDSSPVALVGDPLFAVVGPEGSAVDNLVAIGPRKSDGEGDSEQFKFTNTLSFSDGFGFEHQVLASYTREELSTDSTSFQGDQAVLFNIATGEYFDDPRTPVTPGLEEVRVNDNITFGLVNRGSLINQDFEEQGINILDYVRFNEQWAWLIGGRFSDFQDNTNASFDDDNFSMRTGVVFTPAEDLSFYASYSEGYTNSAGRQDENGNNIDPETSVSIEAGVKWQLLEEQLLITAALYDIDKEDIAFITNPGEPVLFFDNIGAVNSQGFELEVVGYITSQWRIQAGYTFTDTEITEGGTDAFSSTFTEGNQFPGIADHSFNLFSFYEIPIGTGDLGLGGGVFSQSDVFASLENRTEFDSWTQVDLAAYYKMDAWKAQLNVRNITDEEFLLTQSFISSDVFAAGRVGTSIPRSVTASIAYEF